MTIRHIVFFVLLLHFRKYNFIFIKFEMKNDEQKTNYSQLVNCDVSRKL